MKGICSSMESKAKPTLNISANVNSYGMDSDDSWKKKEAKRIKSEIALINKALKNWDDTKAGKQARASLEADLKSKKARLEEYTTQKKFNISMA